MANLFVWSDTHFGHEAILTFVDEAGHRLRPFESVEYMDEYMVGRNNSVVRPNDHVYHLGDVAMAKKNIPTIGRCHGKLRLVRGNHDIYPMSHYTRYFEHIYGVRVLDDIVMSHIPLHPESIKPRWTNVHGHVHNNVGPLHFGPKYFNVCVEMINYTPVALEDLRVMIRQQQEEWCNANGVSMEEYHVKKMWMK